MTKTELNAALVAIIYYEELRQASRDENVSHVCLNPILIERTLALCAKTDASERMEQLRPMFEQLIAATEGNFE